MLIGEAVDTLITLGWALLAWIVTAAVVVTGALYAAAGVVVWAWHAARRACRGAWRGRGAPERGSCGSRVTGDAPEPSDGRTAPHNYGEAA